MPSAVDEADPSGFFVARMVASIVAGKVDGPALTNTALRLALAVIGGQAMLAAVVVLVCALAAGPRAALSAALGAGIGIAATSLMAWAMLRQGPGVSVLRLAMSFFTGWLVKVGVTVALLIVALRSTRIDAAPLVAGYVVTFFGYWIGAARVRE